MRESAPADTSGPVAVSIAYRREVAAFLSLGLNEPVAAVPSFEDPSWEAPALAVGRTFAGYQLLAEIGRGGMGIIYRALELKTRRIVALKMIKPNLVSYFEVRQRFEREVRAAAALDHPNILPVYEVNEFCGIPFYVMKLAAGGSLSAAQRMKGPGDPRDCALLMVKVARALHHAHGRGVLHRDIKPANILLDEGGEPFLADFGLAQLVYDTAGPDLTRTVVILGTPGFIAPEVVSGEAGPAADIYGIGAVLYFLISGRQPFDGTDTSTALKAASAGPPAPLRRLMSTAPKALEAICSFCLQPNAADRYSSAGELAADLEAWLNGARPAIIARRSRRMWVKRGAAAVVASLLIGAAAFAWNQTREHSGRQHAASLQEPKVSAEARYFLTRAGDTTAREHSEPSLRNAEQLVRRALALDPESALVHAELSRILSKIYWHITPDAAVSAEALENAQTALRLDPASAVAHLAMGEYHFRCQRDYPAALQALERAGDLDPTAGVVPGLTALVLKRLNRWEDALLHSRRASELEPSSAPRFYDLAVTCDVMRRYDEAIAAIDRASYLAPDNPAHAVLKAWLLFRRAGDTTGLQQLVEELPFEQQMSPQYFDTVFWWLLWSGRPDEAVRLASSLPENYVVRRYAAVLLKPYFQGLALSLNGQADAAEEAFEKARATLEATVAQTPENARAQMDLGLVYARLGRGDDAVRAGRRAMELLPIEREPVGGAYLAAQMAEIYATLGRPGEATAILEDLLARPGHVTVYDLRLDPRWEPLRSDAEFQRLVQGR